MSGKDLSIRDTLVVKASVFQVWHDVAVSWLDKQDFGNSATPEEYYQKYLDAYNRMKKTHAKG